MVAETPTPQRWYVCAFRSTRGDAVPCGTPTVCKETAAAEAASFAVRGYTTPRFVAFRDLPEWEEDTDV